MPGLRLPWQCPGPGNYILLLRRISPLSLQESSSSVLSEPSHRPDLRSGSYRQSYRNGHIYHSGSQDQIRHNCRRFQEPAMLQDSSITMNIYAKSTPQTNLLCTGINTRCSYILLFVRQTCRIPFLRDFYRGFSAGAVISESTRHHAVQYILQAGLDTPAGS